MEFRPQPARIEHGDFLPAFCSLPVLLVTLVLVELLAMLFLLFPGVHVADPWAYFGLVSLFMQWVTVLSASVLCLLRGPLARLRAWQTGLTAVLVVLGFTALLSGAGIRLELTSREPLPFVLHNLAIALILSAAGVRYFYVQHLWRSNIRAQAQARIDALQARIRPHFLFNSLNTITGLIRLQPQLAEEAVLDLADLFRAALEKSGLIPLQEELELTRNYLRLQQLRLGERLQVEETLDALPSNTRLPALVLQPLVENAMYHGIETLPRGGRIDIRARASGSKLVLSVENPRGPNARAQRGSGTALENVRQRLALQYGNLAELETEETADRFTVRLILPLNQ